MKVTNKENELIISIPKGLLGMREIQEFLDLLRYKMLVSKSKASADQIKELTEEINANLAERNKDIIEDQ
jgi:hypothetical protein